MEESASSDEIKTTAPYDYGLCSQVYKYRHLPRSKFNTTKHFFIITLYALFSLFFLFLFFTNPESLTPSDKLTITAKTFLDILSLKMLITHMQKSDTSFSYSIHIFTAVTSSTIWPLLCIYYLSHLILKIWIFAPLDEIYKDDIRLFCEVLYIATYWLNIRYLAKDIK